MVHLDVATSGDRVRRIAVPGGWLYQTQVALEHESGAHGEAPHYTSGWSQPVFVAEPAAVRPADMERVKWLMRDMIRTGLLSTGMESIDITLIAETIANELALAIA
jgi:hypothetical protein